MSQHIYLYRKFLEENPATKDRTLINFLLQNKSIQTEFVNFLQDFSLEEIVQIKLELASLVIKNRLPPSSFFQHLYYTVMTGVVNFIENNTKTVLQACAVTGLTPMQYGILKQKLRGMKLLPERKEIE